ncbi:hypothetical protein KR093_006141, partial [Drosophila rubida]
LSALYLKVFVYLLVPCIVSEVKEYTRIGSKYYIIGKSKVSWYDSLHMCRRFGGDLVLIESAEELSEISSYLKKQGYDASAWFWTSGNDLVVNRNFQSVVNGLPLPFTAWSPGQPDVPSENCVHLWLQGPEFQMNNWYCTEKAFYICQRANLNNIRC